MKTSEILTTICKVLFPFVLSYGLYVIINGHISPGGGFQGGAILATAILINYLIGIHIVEDVGLLVKVEKYTFIVIMLLAFVSLFTRGELFTNFFSIQSSILQKRIFLILMNFFIGIKVATGLIAIFSTFIEEGE
ncbi:MnhB domain-containing protein [Clostridium sp. D2Q-11]|uniref:MnhB domain-containing protein n=1 Tax=Anaeromonas frigoriresistens TaxID=2683708 RepID=A0A942USJ4_9FIRM|nr:MnhB domain-containing protein [Anaeromonas frigoriresistens]MBS4538353.1 MnhB domain-containing protein [Anaeromonas frigoriresistens]